MKIKTSRALSFISIAIIYLLASVVGIISYFYIPASDLWLKLLIADVIATVFTFIFSLIFNNASVYDPYWSVQPIIIIFAFALNNTLTLPGILLIIAITIWGVRLTANWAYTFKDLTHQDWRYTMLKEQTKKFYPIINFIGIHMVPTLIVYACTLPAVYVIKLAPTFNAGSIIFFICSLLCVLLQGTADIQMHKYRQDKTTPFIRIGLWKYSRHPNYLAEILIWWTVGLASVCVLKDSWYLLGGAILNTILFFSVGIPMADKRQSKKEGFKEYKKQTRMLLPIYKHV